MPVQNDMKENYTTDIHSKGVMELVTVAMEICKRLENAAATPRRQLVDAMLKLLPLLYVKAQLVLHFKSDEYISLEHAVTEDDYNAVRNAVAASMGEYDDFLDVFVEDMKYSDRPVLCTVSENLADIYQELADFLNIFKQDFDESTQAALCELTESFETRWGQILLNTMRPLHDVMYGEKTDKDEEDD